MQIYDPGQRRSLLDLARRSISHGLDRGQVIEVEAELIARFPDGYRASFVTLTLDKNLRGCVGTLEAVRSLPLDIARNAFGAAFRDPRFQPVSAAELPRLHIHLSVLSTPEPLSFRSEHDLLAQIRPFEDGLILQEGGRRGTFLPSVWESLENPRDFLSHLKRKAGLAGDHWSETLRVWRYRAESIGEEEG